jgi:hypothetical protein
MRVPYARALSALVIPLIASSASAVSLLPGDILASGTGTVGTGIIRVDPVSGAQALVAAGDFGDFAMGPNFVYAISGNAVVRIEPLSGIQTTLTQGGYLSAPTGLSLGPSGEIFVLLQTPDGYSADPGPAVVVRVDPFTGMQTLHSVGGGGLVRVVHDLEADPNGNGIILGERVGPVLNQVDAVSGLQTEIPLEGSGFQDRSLGVTPSGDIYFADSGGGGGHQVYRVDHLTGEQTNVGTLFIFHDPDAEHYSDLLAADVVFDASGRVLIGTTAVLNYGTGGPLVPSGIFVIPYGQQPNPTPLTEGVFNELQIVQNLVIPEPSTGLLVAFGLIGFAGWRHSGGIS